MSLLSSQLNKTENLPPTARAIALILSSTPSVQDAQPGVLHQLLEFANRYTQHVLTDARVYAEHKQGGAEGSKVEAEDVVLAVQARVGWEFGGRVPAEYIQSLATQTNSIPLPSVPEVFGVRLPPQSECLTAIDFDLVPNKPPPGIKIFDEEIEEIEESEEEEEDEDEDMDMEPAPIPVRDFAAPEQRMSPAVEQAPFPITAAAPFEDVMPVSRPGEGSDDDEDGLFAGDDDSDADAMEEVRDETETTRKLVETDDYD